MPFTRPALADLQNQVAQDIASGTPGSDALLRFSNLGITGKAQAMLAHLHYGYLDWIAKNAVPFTATAEFLEGWAGLKKVVRNAANVASGVVTFTGTNGAQIPSGTSLIRGDGVAFISTAAATVASGIAVVSASSVADPVGLTGAVGNTALGSGISLGTSIPGVNSTGTVTTAFTGGADLETDASLRGRMLLAYQNPPQGGSATDYLNWALAVTGVTRAWVNRNGFGAGTVVIYTMFDASESVNDGFPQGVGGGATLEPRATVATGDLLAVANYLYSLQPVTALVYSVAPVASPIAFTISGIPTASAAVKAAISASIASIFYLYGTPLGGTVALSLIESAIAAISGTQGFVITTPSGNIATTLGNLPTVGTITYI